MKSQNSSEQAQVPLRHGRRAFNAALRIVDNLWAVFLLVAIWQAWVAYNGYNTVVMPRPLDVFIEISRSAKTYLSSAFLSLTLAVAGLVGGMLLGIGLAIAAWYSRLAKNLLTPLTIIFSSVPVVALTPVIARVLGYGTPTVLCAVIIITFFPAFVFATSGLNMIPPGSNDLFVVLGARKGRLLRLLAIPAALPNMAVALRLVATQSVLAAVVAEFLMGTSGLGYLFRLTIVEMRTELAFGCSVVATLLSVAMFLIGNFIETATRSRWT